MEIPKQNTPIQVDKTVHAQVVDHLASERKIGKFTEQALIEKIEREKLLDIPTNFRYKETKQHAEDNNTIQKRPE